MGLLLGLSSLLTVITRGLVHNKRCTVLSYRSSVIRVSGITVISMSSSSTSSSPSSLIPSLLPANQAVQLYNSNGAKFLDCSWHLGGARNAIEEFKCERISGAEYFDIEDVRDKSSDLPHMMPDSKTFEAAVSKMGISNNDHVVVYTHPNCFSAPR